MYKISQWCTLYWLISISNINENYFNRISKYVGSWSALKRNKYYWYCPNKISSKYLDLNMLGLNSEQTWHKETVSAW